MTPIPITLKAMWAMYDNTGNIIFSSIAWTKEESENKYKESGNLFAAYEKGYSCLMIAVDIEPV